MINQEEANHLMNLEKKKVSNETYSFPSTNDYLEIPIVSIDGRENFLLDVNRKGTIRLNKCTYQERYEKIYILIRVDLNGPPHTNPEYRYCSITIFTKFCQTNNFVPPYSFICRKL